MKCGFLEASLNDAGRLAHEEWGKTGAMRKNIELHEFVVMPNHMHGIVEIVGAHCMRPDSASDDATVQFRRGASGRVQRAPTVGDVVRGYKSAVTKRINQLHNLSNPPVWQRNYYEHIIRNEEAYLKIAEYIQTNPQRWEDDIYHVYSFRKELTHEQYKLFQNQKIRSHWDAEQEQWLFSVIDIVQVLAGSDRPRKYWSDLKKRLIQEGSEVSDKIGQLKMPLANGKSYITDKEYKEHKSLKKENLRGNMTNLELVLNMPNTGLRQFDEFLEMPIRPT